MDFQFPVTITEEDYCRFNEYVMVASDYGKANMRRARILTAVVFVAFTFLLLYLSDGWWMLFFITAGALWLYALLWNLRLKTIMKKSMRKQIKRMKKSSKLPYTPECTLEFYEDHLTERSPAGMTERLYSAIDRVVLVEGQCLYFFMDQQRAYLLPCRCVGEQQEALLAFLEEKGIKLQKEKTV